MSPCLPRASRGRWTGSSTGRRAGTRASLRYASRRCSSNAGRLRGHAPSSALSRRSPPVRAGLPPMAPTSSRRRASSLLTSSMFTQERTRARTESSLLPTRRYVWPRSTMPPVRCSSRASSPSRAASTPNRVRGCCSLPPAWGVTRTAAARNRWQPSLPPAPKLGARSLPLPRYPSSRHMLARG